MVKTTRSTLHMLYNTQQSAPQDSGYIHLAIVPTLPRRTATTTRLSRNNMYVYSPLRQKREIKQKTEHTDRDRQTPTRLVTLKLSCAQRKSLRFTSHRLSLPSST